MLGEVMDKFRFAGDAVPTVTQTAVNTVMSLGFHTKRGHGMS
jgi:hypothetical protein